MAIAIGATTTAATAAAGATSLTLSHETVAGTDRLLLVRVAARHDTDAITVTYGGTAMTRTTVSTSVPATNGMSAEIWSLIAPPVGTANVVVALNETANDIVAAATNLTGVAQSGTFGAAVVAAVGDFIGSTRNVSSAAGELVIDALTVLGSSGTITADTPQTVQANLRTGTATSDRALGASSEPGAGTVSMNWTWPTTVARAHVAIPIKPAPDVVAGGASASVAGFVGD